MYVNLALMCVFIGIKVTTVFLTAYDAWNPKALFGTGEDVAGKQESKRGIHDLEHDSGNVMSAENEDAFAQGTRIVHPSRGLGVIHKIDRSDPRGKPYIVRYANMEQHHYSKAQVLDKLQVDTRHHTEWPEDLRTMFSPGMRIWHFLYGEGFTISIDESRNAPYLLCYINGQTKWYPAPFRDP
jgi:hypothetical protein